MAVLAWTERIYALPSHRTPGHASARLCRIDTIRLAIAEAPRGSRHVVHEHVGRSQFRCDLAILDAEGDGYALAILLDAPDAPVAVTAERYVFRPDILRKFGWRAVDVPGRDWLREPKSDLTRIEATLQGRDDADDKVFDFAQLVEPSPAPPVSVDPPGQQVQQDIVAITRDVKNYHCE